jgi:hypothetical protein
VAQRLLFGQRSAASSVSVAQGTEVAVAWEKRDKRTFYYRGRRIGGKVMKTYCGGGAAGRIAAEADARRRADEQARRITLMAEKERMEDLKSLTWRLHEQCELLAEAALLCAGYHRPFRQPWRKSHAARRAYPELAAAGRR